MKSTFSRLARQTTLVMLSTGALLWSSSALAVVNQYSMTGGWNSIRGTGTVKIPTFGSFGGGATKLLQDPTAGPTITVPPWAFTFPTPGVSTPLGHGNPGRIAGVSAVPFRQLRTNYSGFAPLEMMKLAPGGRTGPDVVSFCPQIKPQVTLPGGTTIPALAVGPMSGTVLGQATPPTGWNSVDGLAPRSCPHLASGGNCNQAYANNHPPPVATNFSGGYNPFCTAINAGTNGTGVSLSQNGLATSLGVGLGHGRLRYKRTIAGLGMGGVGQAGLIGTGDLGFQLAPPGGTTAPGIFAWIRLLREREFGPGAQAEGGSFDNVITAMLRSGPANLVFSTTGAGLGLVTPSGLGPPFLNTMGGTIIIPPGFQTAWGGPLTTGQVKVSVTANPGAAIGNTHLWTLTGYDNRTAGGEGAIQFVSGGMSRTGSSVSGNRLILTMNMTSLPEPSSWLAAGGALLALVACRSFLRRR